MFQHLLVPLDGSRLAESALPTAAYLAETLNASVTLVHVIERHAPQVVHGDRHLTDPDAASAYLAETASSAFPAEVRVDRHVHTVEVGNVARSLVQHAGELKPDLIVMCSHGSGGLRDWLFGSIAHQVISLGTTSVLVVHPTPGQSMSNLGSHKVLVPLDADPAHEQGLTVAAALAQACQSALHLLVVVPTLGTLPGERAAAGRMMPGAMGELLDITKQSAEEYLNRHNEQLQLTGLEVSTEVGRGDPSVTIVNTAERIHAGLIVFGTHRKAGTEAFWSGSVTPKVSSRTGIPLLLVPVVESTETE